MEKFNLISLLKGSLKSLRRSKRPLVILAIVHLLLILAFDGFLYQDKNIPKQEVELDGRITEFKTIKGKDIEYNITVKNVEKPFRKLLLKLDENLMKRSGLIEKRVHLLGERLRFKGEFQEFKKRDLEGSFDIKSHYENEGYSGFVRVKALKLILNDSYTRALYLLPNFLFRLKENIKKSFNFILGKAEAGTLSAMLLGEKTGLTSEIKVLYSDNAISHILAISGLHVSIIGMLIHLFCKKLKFSYRLSAMIPLIFLFLYGLLTGFSVSTARAVIMMSLFFLSFILNKVYDIPTALAISGVIILLFNHRFIYQAGFQLSFMSVIGIYYGLKLSEKIFLKERRREESKILILRNIILASILCTITINLFILPIQLWYYFEVSLNGILLNIVVIPLMSVLIIMGLVGGLVSIYSFFLGAFFLGSCSFILKLYTFLCEIMEWNRWNKVVFGRPGFFSVIFYYSLLFFVLKILWKLDRKEKILKLKGSIDKEDLIEMKAIKKAFILIVLFISIFCLTYKKKETKVKTLELGRGFCKIVRLESGKAYLIDCGSKTVKNFVKYQLIPYLKYFGISKIEGIFLTDVIEEKGNGLMALMEYKEIRIKKIFFPEKYRKKEGETVLLNQILFHLKKRKVEIIFLQDGAELKEENMTFILKKDEKRRERRVLLKRKKN